MCSIVCLYSLYHNDLSTIQTLCPNPGTQNHKEEGDKSPDYEGSSSAKSAKSAVQTSSNDNSTWKKTTRSISLLTMCKVFRRFLMLYVGVRLTYVSYPILVYVHTYPLKGVRMSKLRIPIPFSWLLYTLLYGINRLNPASYFIRISSRLVNFCLI